MDMLVNHAITFPSDFISLLSMDHVTYMHRLHLQCHRGYAQLPTCQTPFQVMPACHPYPHLRGNLIRTRRCQSGWQERMIDESAMLLTTLWMVFKKAHLPSNPLEKALNSIHRSDKLGGNFSVGFSHLYKPSFLTFFLPFQSVWVSECESVCTVWLPGILIGILGQTKI